MYEYRVKVIKIVDGDTVDVDIELGFGVVLANERVRVMGIDTPESRTSDEVEKVFGLLAKHRLQELIGKVAILRTQISPKGEDMKGKFGRIIGDFFVYDAYRDIDTTVTEVLIHEGHAVPYFGGSKEDTQAAHMVNRARLIAEGKVTV